MYRKANIWDLEEFSLLIGLLYFMCTYLRVLEVYCTICYHNWCIECTLTQSNCNDSCYT